MFQTIDEQKAFCRQFNISEERFREAALPWIELESIAADYQKRRDGHTATVKNYLEKIEQCEYVHSLSCRVKDTAHLIEKIIRKNPKYLQQGKAITSSN